VADQFAGHGRLSFASALPYRHSQRRHHQVGVFGRGDVPGHDPLSEHVDDERDVDEPGPGEAVGEVGNPDAIACHGGEVAVQQVTGSLTVLGGIVVRMPLSRLRPDSPRHRIARSTAPNEASWSRRRRTRAVIFRRP